MIDREPASLRHLRIVRAASSWCSIALGVLAVLLAYAPVARADRPDLTQGRGLVWGASATVPILLGDVRYVENGAPASVVAPGFGVDAHIGWEFEGGFRAEIVADVDGHAVTDQVPLARYRFGAQARLTLDVGSDFYPLFAVGVACALFNRNTSLGATIDVRGMVGGGWWAAPWFAIEVSLAADVAFPGWAFTDTTAMLTPMIGVDISF